MSAIGPGDWVECVDASPHKYFPRLTEALAARAVYQVRAVVVYGEKAGLLLREIVNPLSPRGVEYAYVPERFRPIYRPKSELITDLLKSVDEPIREDA